MYTLILYFLDKCIRNYHIIVFNETKIANVICLMNIIIHGYNTKQRLCRNVTKRPVNNSHMDLPTCLIRTHSLYDVYPE